MIDLAVARDLGGGRDVILSLLVTTAFTADDTALTTNPVTLWTSPGVAVVQGSRLVGGVPRSTVYALGQRYLGIVYTVATGPFTAGRMTASLGDKPVEDAGVLYARATSRRA